MTKLKFLPGIILFLLFSISLSGQAHALKWGEIPPEHLRMTSYEGDTSASAIILQDYGKLNFDFRDTDPKTVLVRHKRIKILKRSGFDYGDVSITYYSEKGYEAIRGLKATIFNPDGSSKKLGKKDFFEEKIDDKWTKIKFTFPDLQAGSVIEYTYQKSSKAIFSLPEWYFQHEIPVFWSEYELFVPKWYTYVTMKQGRFAITSQNWVQDNFAVSQGNAFQGRGMGNVSLEVNHMRFAASMLPALKEEGFITTMDDYRTRVRMQLSGTNFSSYKPVMGDWKTSAKRLMEDLSFGVPLTKESDFRDALKAVKPLVADVTDVREKTQIIYDFVNKNIEWDGDYYPYIHDRLKDCYTKKSAASGELNLLLIALLKSNGITAYPMMLSTRTNGKMTNIYPILSQFNHTMAYVKIGEQWLILDAGDDSRPMGMPRINALNSMGWLVHPANPRWVEIKAQKGSSVYLADFEIDEEGVLIGEIKEMHKGYNAANSRDDLDAGNCQKKISEGFTKLFPDAEVSEVKVEALNQRDKPFTYSANLNIPDLAHSTGEFIYISPVLIKAFKENPFKMKNRQYPVDMPYPNSERYIFKLELPEDYVVEELPETMRIKMPDGAASFHFEVKQVGSFLQLTSSVSFNKLRYEPEEYASLQNFVDLIIEKQSEQIVLKLED